MKEDNTKEWFDDFANQAHHPALNTSSTVGHYEAL